MEEQEVGMKFGKNKKKQEIGAQATEIINKKTGKKEMEYVLSITGSKWQIVKTNFIAGIFRGAGFRNWYNNNNSNNRYCFKGNGIFKYSYNRGVYNRYCKNS